MKQLSVRKREIKVARTSIWKNASVNSQSNKHVCLCTPRTSALYSQFALKIVLKASASIMRCSKIFQIVDNNVKQSDKWL